VKAWFIESMDALGGRAFTSFREPLREGRAQQRIVASRSTTYIIVPPDFSPEPVGQATALAASRGIFQAELRDANARAIPFARLDDVIEFVRRAFTSGGGGIGGGGRGGAGPGGGGGGEPPPPEERDIDIEGELRAEQEPLDARGEWALNVLDRAARTFALHVRETTLGSPGRPLGPPPKDETIRQDEQPAGGASAFWRYGSSMPDSSSLVFAARSMLELLLYRAPRAKHGEPLAQWNAAMCTLGSILLETGTFSTIFEEIESNRNDTLSQATRRIPWAPFDMQGEAGGWRIAEWLAGTLGIHLRYWRGGELPATLRKDPFDRLYALPVSLEAERAMGWGHDDTASLAHLLARFLASPHIVLGIDSRKRRRAIIGPCLLAAASLVAPGVAGLPVWSWATSADEVFLRELTRAACDWLCVNLPRVALPADLEALIERSASLDMQATSQL
jgi:hypothetical protein